MKSTTKLAEPTLVYVFLSRILAYLSPDLRYMGDRVEDTVLDVIKRLGLTPESIGNFSEVRLNCTYMGQAVELSVNRETKGVMIYVFRSASRLQLGEVEHACVWVRLPYTESPADLKAKEMVWDPPGLLLNGGNGL